MSSPTLHPLLRYSQHDGELGHCCPLLWDLRESPRTARHVSAPDRTLSALELSQHATNPPVSLLRVTCGIFPQESWVAEAQNWLGVTVGNVLDAIFETVNTQITYPEWNQLCPKQQDRVNIVFDARWRRFMDAAQVRERGVLRSDCVLLHVLFAGLSLAPDMDATYLLTLKRPKR
ncbi:ectomycorrhiza-regulated small secreted protein [Mycena albidolilacea]|uniref:Ectomycorrhiza-regulated small secreted protein n=1 Tax=Mycena albidolilacea TaxID=1033008 RepID=A0AAD6ZBX0_9AGAR|nr:ectomycorrhiza-regulated small secreted protein [Mycena albidolilacea]